MRKYKNIIFDLDNTLYPLSINSQKLFDDRCRTGFTNEHEICWQNAHEFLRDWREKYHHDMAALKAASGLSMDDIMEYVCDIDMSVLEENAELNNLLQALSTPKYIFTDSTVKHVDTSLQELGISRDIFDGIFVSEHSGYHFKPHPQGFAVMLNQYKINPTDAVMVEDNHHNLKTAKALGMQTIWISDSADVYPYCDYKFADIISAVKFMLEHQ